MSRVAKPVNKEIFIQCVNQAELDGPLTGISVLCNKVAELYNQKDVPAQLTSSVVYLRLRQFEINTKTSSNKKRGFGGSSGTRTTRADKINSNIAYTQSIKAIREMITKNKQAGRLPLVDRIEKGSLTAAVKLNCLECAGFFTVEVKNCECMQCPLWIFRPYQTKE